MFDAFHPIDDRILMRVLSIVFNVRVYVCVDGFISYALKKKTAKKLKHEKVNKKLQ